MNTELMKVALRQRAVYIEGSKGVGSKGVGSKGVRSKGVGSKGVRSNELSAHTLSLVAELRQQGFTLSEDALWAVNGLDENGREELLAVINDVMGTKLNWASLVRGWLVPTGESVWDHFITFLANLAKTNSPLDPKGSLCSLSEQEQLKGVTMPCGHFIPEGTFPIERYTGCPFCGKPFQTAGFTYKGQGTKLRLLTLWDDDDLHRLFTDLLASPVALDATQRESLKTLLHYFLAPLQADTSLEGIFNPRSITQKETIMLVANELVALRRDDEAGRLFTMPSDILRYLWYRKTNRLLVLRPATILHTVGKNSRIVFASETDISARMAEEKAQLKLKYDRGWCRRVAKWLNDMVGTDQMLESMHPKREMWVRFIRALRLAEYSHKKGFEPLAALLDRFHRQDYQVWQSLVDSSRRRNNADETLRLLEQRPGLFARCLFSTMLTFGPQRTLETFRRVTPKLPIRLLLTLGSQAQLYFDRNQKRAVRTITGLTKTIDPNPLLMHYTDEQLQQMATDVNQLYLDTMRQHFASLPSSPTERPSVFPTAPSSPPSVFIDPQLYHIPMAVADRSETIQDVSAALQGTRFPIQGDNVRLFLQWGKDLPAQHLDMDLSCDILKDPAAGAKPVVCSYFSLSVPGARHSGDIRQIPDMVGTAEYIELSIPELQASGAKRVVFSCNAYSAGALSPNLMVGWMSAEHPMTVSDENGVAYDPSTVDHIVRISESNLSKGLIFGVLDVEQREITWLEMPFDGQTVLSISAETVDTFLRRLQAKPSIGQILAIRAEALGQTMTDDATTADEVFTLEWARNTAQVSRLLLA